MAPQFVEADRVLMDVSELDMAAQQISSQLVLIGDGSVRTYPVRIRYAYPAELDLMARLAGLRLLEGWAGGAVSRSNGPAASMYPCMGEHPASSLMEPGGLSGRRCAPRP